MESTAHNNFILNDFITSKSHIDGLIVNSKNDLDYIKIIIDLRNLIRKDYTDLNSFLDSDISDNTFCLINMDKQQCISEEESLKMFQKVRSKLKIVFYNESSKSLSDEGLFTFLNWMRIIRIENIDYFGLPANSNVLLKAKGIVKYGLNKSIFREAEKNETIEVYAYFNFPLTTNSFEKSFLQAINSNKNINTRYKEVNNIKIVQVDKIGVNGYSLGKIDMNFF